MLIVDSLRTTFKGKLGLKFSNGLYIPRTYHLFEKERKEVLKINTSKNKKIYKIVVVLDEYLDLAELSNRYLAENYRDTWVVNIFALQKILWISTRINGINTFFEYLEYRTQNYLAIESLHSDELAQFGYWISSNHHFYPPVDLNVSIIIGNRFTCLFDSYDSYFWGKLEQELRVKNE